VIGGVVGARKKKKKKERRKSLAKIDAYARKEGAYRSKGGGVKGREGGGGGSVGIWSSMCKTDLEKKQRRRERR